MPKIFVSYRRKDAAGFAGRLTDVLEMRFGKGSVFRDIDDIPPGRDFVEALDAALAATAVFILMIGPDWLGEAGDSGSRLNDPDDFVRREVAMALSRSIHLIPVLLEGARMPAAGELPTELADLSRRQALALEDRSWSSDVQQLIAAIEPALEGMGPGTGYSAADAKAEVQRAKRRGLLWLALLSGIGAAAYAGWYMSRVPDLSGEWRLDDGSRWRVRQDGKKLEIEEVHYQSREVWRAGTGRITDEGIAVDLRYLFQPGVTLHGTLRLSDDARMLDGVLTELPGERLFALDLQR